MVFRIKPAIHSMDTVAELFEEFNIGKDDLIITNEYVLMPHLADRKPECEILFQEKFGAGEPSDEMIDGILLRVNKRDYKRIFAIGGGTVLDIGKLLVFDGSCSCREIFEKARYCRKKGS